MKEQDRALLLSVRPVYAESIMSGSKLAEIRRQRPSVLPGTPVIIYATQPLGAVIGSARIADVQEGAPNDIWASYAAQMGISRAEFDNYLSGTNTAYVLVLVDMQRLEVPLTLEDMRATVDFHPPRSYRYVDREALSRLVNGHPGGGSLLAMLSDGSSLLLE